MARLPRQLFTESCAPRLLPNRQDLLEVYWRSAFFDYEGKLPTEYGSKFKEYLNWMSDIFKMGKEIIIQREIAFSAVPFYLCAFATLLGWTFSKTLRRGRFLPRFGRCFLDDFLARCWNNSFVHYCMVGDMLYYLVLWYKNSHENSSLWENSSLLV